MSITVQVTRDDVVVVGVSTVAQGLPGPKGDPGIPGNALNQYVHLQTVAAAVWVVNHNSGFRPQVSILSSGGVEMWAEIIHANVNQVLVYFDDPKTGSVICS